MTGKKAKARHEDAAVAEAAGVLRFASEPTSCIHLLTRERLLTPDEEALLATAARQGDRRARNRLIEANMRLVINIAKHYHCPVVPFEDLVQEGAIGLMTACERYDPLKGYRFSTYATHWIRQAISRSIDNKAHAIRVPAHVSETLRKIERARATLLREAGEEPSVEQVAERVGMPPPKVAAYLQAAQDPLSLDMLVGEEESTSLGALINDRAAPDPQADLMSLEVRRELQSILETLSERERMVMRRRLGFDDDEAHVLQDIGDELKISRERVRQIEAQALRRLRAAARRRRLGDFLLG
ncbi:MAG: sigma-70 family RNA polymerase sigma factor [Chthonomonadales bacterium]|nr:sigma-70 family RNA polymerase sigma factor [Chthonomonadales bacterium]